MPLKFIDKLVIKCIVLFMAMIVAAISWQVISRHLLAEPSAVSGELSRFLLIWIGLLGAAYGYRVNAHLSLNIVTQQLSETNQQHITIFGHVIVCSFAVIVMIIGGAQLVNMTLESQQLSPVMHIKMGYVYSIIPISGILMTLYAIDKLRALFNTRVEDIEQASTSGCTVKAGE